MLGLLLTNPFIIGKNLFELPMNSSKPAVVTKKAKKKATKKLVKAVTNGTIVPKMPSQSSNPGKQVAKNVMSTMQKMSAEQVKILLSVMCPKDFEPQRLGSQLGAYQTAVANTYAVTNAGWADLTSPSSGSISGSVTANYVFRDPFRFSVHSIPNPTTTVNYEYRTTLDATVFYSTQLAPLSFGRLGWFSGQKPHGDFLYPGKLSSAPRTYAWVDAKGAIVIQNGSGIALYAVPYYYRSDGQISKGALNAIAVGASASFTVGVDDGQNIGCYVGFDLSLQTGTASKLAEVQIIVNSQNQAGIWWGHRSLPWIDSNISSIDAIKIYGASLMLTNEASPLNRQGKLAAAQITEGRDWRQFTDYDSLTEIKDSYINSIVNGYYGFLKPTQPRDYDFRDQTYTTYTGAVSQGWFMLDNPSDFLACVGVVTDVNGRDAYITTSVACEYRTEDQFRDVRKPTAPWEVVNQAMAMICGAPQHHENPFHISDIFDWIGEQFSGLWRGVKQAYPMVMDGLNTAIKVGGIVAPLMAL
jgi:hypothetical protein